MVIYNPFQNTPPQDPQKLWGSGSSATPFYSGNPNPWGGGGFPTFPSSTGALVGTYNPSDEKYFAKQRESREFRRTWTYDRRTGPK